MLQQTRVESVFGYFERFMARFPTPSHVARAPVEEILDAWAGLGYYARARNLHHACCEIEQMYAGKVPSDPDDFGRLKGVGDYTRGAVMSIAFNRAEPIVDGNVERVFARLFLVDENVRLTPTKKRLWALAREWVSGLAPEHKPGDANQALMELGALVCLPKAPKCEQCPVQKHCAAFESNRVHELPVKSKPAPKKTTRLKALLCTDDAGRIWVTRRPNTGVLAGLWSLPMQPVEQDGFTLMSPPVVQIKHVFTHLIWLVDLYREDAPVHTAPTTWGPVSRAMTPDELATVALGGPSLKALIKAGIKLPRRRGAG
jgi:A/G-specific adenine glycosylase